MKTFSALDRQLAVASLALVFFGLLTLYSAGQTDVPTRAVGVWWRQFVWFGAGIVVAWMAYMVSPRILEWAAPALYAVGVVLLVIVLAVGTGAGTAESSHSWLAIGKVRIGQPAEFAKVGTVLMLARYLGLQDALSPAVNAYWKRLSGRPAFKAARAAQVQGEAA